MKILQSEILQPPSPVTCAAKYHCRLLSIKVKSDLMFSSSRNKVFILVKSVDHVTV